MDAKEERKKKSARAQRAEASKKRIYKTAIQIIGEKGFEAASVADICRAAGCSVGVFYHYFGSKDGVVAENFRLADERFIVFAREELPDVGAEEKIVAYFERYARLVSEETGLDVSKRFYTCGNKLFVKKGRAMQTELVRIIDAALDDGELRLELNAEEACDWLFMGARGVAFHWCLRDGDFDLIEAMKVYARRALRGIRA